MEKLVFEFTNYDVPVAIAGHEFMLNCSSDTGDFLKEVGTELKNLAAEMSAGAKTKDDVIAYGMGVIDKLLGTGAAEKVFGSRERRLSDIMDLCMFLTEAAATFIRARSAQTGNRAQGRTAVRK